MLNAVHNQRGFSLLELMIAIAIASLLMMLGAPSFVLWIQNSQTRTAAEAIQNGLQLARAEAVKRNGRVQIELCGLPNSSWQIEAITNTAAVEAQSFACPAAVPVAGEVRIQERSAQEGSSNTVVSVTRSDASTATTGSAMLTFNGMGQVTTNSDTSAALTRVDVTNPRGDRPLSITINAGGSIHMCNPSLPSSDPQGC
jgi:type IV fimbrial biogenesis protein FimT